MEREGAAVMCDGRLFHRRASFSWSSEPGIIWPSFTWFV